MAKTLESIANKALIKLGKKPSITSIKGESNDERMFAEIMPGVISNSIRKYRPNCCVSRAILSQDPNYTPRWGFRSGYKYPENMTKLLEVDNNTWYPDDFPIEGQWILTHHHKPAQPGDKAPELRVKYLENKPVSMWDDDFFNLVALEVAVEIAPIIDQTREAMVIALRNSEADRWASDNAMENGFEVEEYDPLFGVVHKIRS